MSEKTKISIWGRYAPLGLVLIAVVFGIDQAHKWWMLTVYNIASLQPVQITPFFNLVLVWNTGVSYGWLKDLGPWLLITGQLLISLLLWLWLAGARDRVSVLATALVIGGALGNVTDRIIHGAVADFFHLHAYGFSWYVFNIADVAIVAGAALLLYGSYREMADKKP